jgi:hypothetical protein
MIARDFRVEVTAAAASKLPDADDIHLAVFGELALADEEFIDLTTTGRVGRPVAGKAAFNITITGPQAPELDQIASAIRSTRTLGYELAHVNVTPSW